MQPIRPYGLHRVLEPLGVMPQAAWKVDSRPLVEADELLISVETLNIDSASFRQICESCENDETKVKTHILEIIQSRGKMHNPVTGSGGMLIGRVASIGEVLAPHVNVQVGDRVATLVSLSLTPLHIERIRGLDLANGQVDVDGSAILFASGIYAKMPDDLPDRIALAVFDVCGAPAQTARIVKPGNDVVILGAGGKSGLLALAAARKSTGDGRVIAVDYGEAAMERIHRAGFADAAFNLDATKAIEVYEAVTGALGGALADVVINCVNVPNTEMTTILPAKEDGIVYFFSMATSFTAAALGAEGVGKDVQMMIGNGYCRNHADYALELVRTTPELMQMFQSKYANTAI